MARKLLFSLVALTLALTLTIPASAHRSGCHRWHSCISDSGSYTCGDIGYCSQCPDNQYCENQQPRRAFVEPLKPQPTPKAKLTEKDYQKPWCERAGGEIEYVLEDSTRVDCLTSEYAIEFDFGKKWAESIGQSLYYAMMTGKKPGVVLIVKKQNSRYVKKLMKVANKYQIKVWVIER